MAFREKEEFQREGIDNNIEKKARHHGRVGALSPMPT